ncbi:MAG: AbrB/MazE/SpoVT family DNA-binding domain-containing protein, partial [Pseudomonadota bacterium]
ALRLPRHVIDEASLKEGEAVDICVEDNKIIITPARKRLKLSELLAEMKEDTKHPETDWGPPQGDEEW